MRIFLQLSIIAISWMTMVVMIPGVPGKAHTAMQVRMNVVTTMHPSTSTSKREYRLLETRR
jgi:hypothetical protein